MITEKVYLKKKICSEKRIFPCVIIEKRGKSAKNFYEFIALKEE
jgi:hypothetical protein